MTALRYHSSKPHGAWTAPVGTAAHDFKWGRIQPMEEQRKPFWQLRRERKA